MSRKKVKFKGGAPTNDMKREWVSLQQTKLFNRDSELYTCVENSFGNLSPSKMFEAFSRLCMVRDDRILHQILKTDFSEESNIGEELHRWMLSDEKRMAYIDDKSSLIEVKSINVQVFYIYLQLLDSKKLVDMREQEDAIVSSNKGFSLIVEYEIKLKHIYAHYDKKKQDEIMKKIVEHELAENYELNHLNEQFGNEVAIKMIGLVLIDNFKVPIKYIKEKDTLFYIENFREEDYKDEIHKSIQETMSFYSTTAAHSSKYHTVKVNPKKPSKYYEELFEQLQLNLSIDTQEINRTYDTVVSHNSTQKHLAGKIVDLLYIYDNRIFGFSSTWIIGQLTDYWKNQRPEYWRKKKALHHSMSRSTYYKYQKVITNFIDNKYYKL